MRRSFPHGTHPPEHKLTAGMPVRRMPFAPLLLVPLKQHAGRPALPVVVEGQTVERGQLIARADGFRSVPMHAPAAGRVRGIGPGPTATGELVETMYLEPFPSSTQLESPGLPRDLDALDRDALIAAIQAAGLVGMGGAGFPTHAKLKAPPDRQVELCIVNGAECEPYLTSDHRVMVERTEDVLRGLALLMRAVGAPRAVIAVEANKPDAIAKLRAALRPEDPVTVEVLEVKYPEGAARILIKALLGREVPRGGHSYDVGVEVSNVATVAEIGKLLPQGRGLIERVMTVSGPGVQRPGNYLIPLGTPLRFVLETVGLTSGANVAPPAGANVAPPAGANVAPPAGANMAPPAGDFRVVLGGPMMGRAVASLDVPVTKADTGILVFPVEANADRAELPCIRCGACVAACPLFLNPARLGLLARHERFEEMSADYNLSTCFECGTCAYVCPSHIPLVQYFRLAKTSEWKRKEREAAARDGAA